MINHDDRDIGAYMREIMRDTGYDIDTGQYTDSDDSMSIQDLAAQEPYLPTGDDEHEDFKDAQNLAVMRGHEAGDEDLHDYDEETYNQMLMDTGDF